MNDLEDRIARLPVWAREHIHRLAIRGEPFVEEAARCRRKVAELQSIVRKQNDRIEAMVDMFQCAARGGNEIAMAVKSIVESFLISDEE